MLNHAERPLGECELPDAMRHARDAGLLTLVCADDIHEAKRYAEWSPDMILLEPHDLIGTTDGRNRPSIAHANAAIASVDPDVLVMHSGGVADERDVHAIIAQGADGTGCTSAIVRAGDRREMTARMIRAVRGAWDARGALMATSTPDAGKGAH